MKRYVHRKNDTLEDFKWPDKVDETKVSYKGNDILIMETTDPDQFDYIVIAGIIQNQGLEVKDENTCETVSYIEKVDFSTFMEIQKMMKNKLGARALYTFWE